MFPASIFGSSTLRLPGDFALKLRLTRSKAPVSLWIIAFYFLTSLPEFSLVLAPPVLGGFRLECSCLSTYCGCSCISDLSCESCCFLKLGGMYGFGISSCYWGALSISSTSSAASVSFSMDLLTWWVLKKSGFVGSVCY